jgi:hypothetical protein
MQRRQTPAAPEDERLRLGGAVWRVVKDSTLEHDFCALRAARAIGVDDAGMLPGESAEQFAQRLLAMVIDSGQVFDLLGCMVLPETVPDERWTPAEAARTADFLRALRAPEDKAEVQSLVVSLLIGFFADGLRSSGAFRTALTARTQPTEP